MKFVATNIDVWSALFPTTLKTVTNFFLVLFVHSVRIVICASGNKLVGNLETKNELFYTYWIIRIQPNTVNLWRTDLLWINKKWSTPYFEKTHWHPKTLMKDRVRSSHQQLLVNCLLAFVLTLIPMYKTKFFINLRLIIYRERKWFREIINNTRSADGLFVIRLRRWLLC